MSGLVFPITSAATATFASREPFWDTRIDESTSAMEVRSSWASFPRYRYEIRFASLLSYGGSRLDYQKITSFHARHGGQLDSFLLEDPEDYTVTSHYFGVGDGFTQDFQLQRAQAADADLPIALGRSYWPHFGDGYEPIFELNGAPSIYKDAVLQTAGPNYTLNALGVIHFNAVPAIGALLSWSGTYYRRVRFADASFQTSRIVPGFWSGSVKLISVKPQEAIALASTTIKSYTDTSFAGTIGGTINGTSGSDGNAVFTLARAPLAGWPVNVERNGIGLVEGLDYTRSANGFTMLAPNIPMAGPPVDQLACDYYSVV